MAKYKTVSGVFEVNDNDLDRFFDKFPSATKVDITLGETSVDQKSWFDQAMDAGAINADLYDNADAIFDISNTEQARKLTDTELNTYIDLYERSKEAAGEMTELNKFTESFQKYNKDGENWLMSTVNAVNDNGGIFGGGMKGFAQASIQSFRSMANKELLKESVAPTIAGVGAGLAATPIGSIAGGTTAFFTSMNYGLETINTFNELLEEEIKNANLEFNPESIRTIMANDEARARIKSKARKRGATIATVEGVTNMLGIKGAGAVSKAVGDVSTTVGRIGKRTGQITAATGIEAVGGGAGEFAGAKAIGKDASGVEIVLEGLSMAPFTAVKDVSVAAIEESIKRPSYEINGTKVSKQAVQDYVNGAKTAEEIGGLNVKINNDDAFAQTINNQILNTQLETQIDTRVSDVNDRKKLVDLEKQRAKAEADTKKIGIFKVVDADAKLQNIQTQIDDIINKYSDVDRRTKDVRARKKFAKDVDVARKQVLVGKTKETVEKFIKEGKLQGQVTEMTSDEISNIDREGFDSKEAAKQFGFIDQKADGSFEIILNKDKPMIGTAAHEFMHAVLFKTLGNTQALQDNLGNALTEHVTGLGGETSILGQRLKAYGKYEDGVFKRDANFGEETLTIMSEEILNGNLKFEENFFTKIGDIIRRFSQDYLGKEIKFETGRDVYNFVKDYSKSIKEGKVNKAILKLAKKGAKGKLVEGVEVKAEPVVQMSKESSDNVQRIYEEQGVGGVFDIINEFKPIVNRIVDKRKDAPGFDRQLLTDEIETGERGILDLIGEYKPESGVPLAAFINKFLPARAIEASRRVLGEEFTVDVTEAKTVAAEEVAEVEVKPKPKKKKIVLAERLGVTEKVSKAIDKIVPNLDIDKLTFKTLKNKIPSITGELFGIAPKKIESLANLTKKELQSAQMFINKNADLLIAMLPEGATPSGTATGVPNTLLKAFYTKTERAKAAKTGSKAGLAIQQKKAINKKEFLEIFGIVDGKPDRTDRNTSARVLALANLTGKMITNQAVRTELAKNKVDSKAINKIAEGKSATMFSKDVKDFNIGGTIDNLLSTHKDKVGRTTFKLNTEQDVDLYIEALINDVLPLMPRDFWFGTPDKEGVFGSEFTPSNRAVDNKDIYRYYQSNILALNQLPDEAFGQKINGVTDYSRPAYKSLFEGKKGVQVDKIIETNKRARKIHEALWSRIYEAVQKDPTKAAAIGNYFKLVSKKVNHWHRFGAEIVGYSLNPKGDGKKIYEYEHAMPATASYLYLLDGALKGYDFKSIYNPVMDNFKLIALDAAENKKLSLAGLGSAMPEGWNTIDNKWWERYFNNQVDIDPNSIVTLKNKTFKEEFGIPSVKPNLKGITSFSKAIQNSRVVNDPKGITVLDFDDTLATTKSLVKYTTPEQTLVYNASPKSIKELGKRSGVIYLATDRKEADAYAKSNRGEVRGFVIDDANIVNENIVLKEMQDQGVDISEGLLYEMIDSRFPDFYIGKKNVDKVFNALRKKGIKAFRYEDGSQISSKTTKSIAVIDKSAISEPGTLNAEQYANTYQDLLDQGYTFDFSDFNKVVKGKLAPLFQKALKLQNKFGPENMFVLTARPPQAQKAIYDFLKANGLNIPLKNITGLANSTSEAKALWIADKVGEGYNDFYFADDALQNVQAVKNMLDQFDVKSKVQQAKVNFSKDINDQFNDILKDVTGIASEKRFSNVKARKRGADKGKFRFFIPPSHEDFVGLLYNFMGKGRQGDAHRDFFENALIRPLNRSYRELNTARQSIANDYKNLNKQFPDIKEKLTKKTPDGDFKYQDAIRVYLWDKHGYDIPGLSETDQKELVDLVKSDGKLQAYADTINVISKRDDYVSPIESWEAGDLRTDLDDATGRIGREQFFTEFFENADIIFSPENMNKIEAAYGVEMVDALKDMLYRTKTGRNRPSGQNKQVNQFMNWLNGSVAATMFFNIRSAVLQQMSLVNFINFSDNNILSAAKAFANQKQYWADWAMLFNSDFMKQRRGGIMTDVNGAELAASVRDAKNPAQAVIKKLLEIGFLPTQIGDNIAIATGGAPFYRNRVNSYLKEGLSQKEAEQKAFVDFQVLAEATQQSARPDMVSQQQASPLGKVILAFQNVTSQFNRLGKKAFLDIKNRRITPGNRTQLQSDISNMSRIAYYFAIQNLIFYSLQSALFTAMFDDDEDDERYLKKKERMINGSIDSVLRGAGVWGAVVATLKNMAIKRLDKKDQKRSSNVYDVLAEGLQVSPPLGIKARKLVQAERDLVWKKKTIEEMDTFDIENPIWSAYTSYIEGITNIPVNRLYNKTLNIREALDTQNSAMDRLLMFSGWSKWNLGIEETKKSKVKQKFGTKKSVKPKRSIKF